jgi:hypothetical protein
MGVGEVRTTEVAAQFNSAKYARNEKRVFHS